MKIRYINPTVAAYVCASLIGSVAMSQAAVVIGDIISINLNTSTGSIPSGAAVIGQTGDIWNNIGVATWNSPVNGTYAMNTTTGASSGVSMTFAGDATGHGAGPIANLDVYEGAFKLDPGASTATITFSGFTAGTMVDLYLYSGGFVTSEGGKFTFNSIAQSVINTGDIETSYNLGDNYVKFANLVADVSGNISGTWANVNNTNYSTFNGAQILVVPEPSTALLSGIGMLCLLRRRRA
jgi:hypothetical protein